MADLSDYSLADFLFPYGDDLLTPPQEFNEWMETNQWALSLMEPRMLGAVAPRMWVERAGKKSQVVNLSSYNYLGLATHPEVLAAADHALRQYGTGACGSPLLSGMSDMHRELEVRLAAFLGREDCILFNSGFGGGMGSLASLLRKGDVAILDNRCHLCLIDGVRVCNARLVLFDHNDPESLDEALTTAAGRRCLVVIEGVYSMDGDTADLPALLPVAEQHGVGMFIDEAHSMLVFGENGRGLLEHHGVGERVPLQFATFSKAFAGVGGFTCGKKDLLRYMRFYSNAYGFSCALPPSVVGGLLKALEVATRDNDLRNRLWENTDYFRQQALDLGLNLGDSNSQVIPIIIGSDRRLLYELCTEMQDKGLFLAPVDYPAVPEDGLRYRVAITAVHEREDLDQALQILKDTVLRRVH